MSCLMAEHYLAFYVYDNLENQNHYLRQLLPGHSLFVAPMIHQS